VPNVTFTHNSVDLTGVANSVGILVTNSLLTYGYGGTQATLVNNQITNSTIGIEVDRDPLDTSADSVSASISDGSITGGTTGILVTGSGASASISDVAIHDPVTGIEV